MLDQKLFIRRVDIYFSNHDFLNVQTSFGVFSMITHAKWLVSNEDLITRASKKAQGGKQVKLTEYPPLRLSHYTGESDYTLSDSQRLH